MYLARSDASSLRSESLVEGLLKSLAKRHYGYKECIKRRFTRVFNIVMVIDHWHLRAAAGRLVRTSFSGRRPSRAGADFNGQRRRAVGLFSLVTDQSSSPSRAPIGLTRSPRTRSTWPLASRNLAARRAGPDRISMRSSPAAM